MATGKERRDDVALYEKLLWWRIGPLCRRNYFLFCCAGVMTFHTLGGILQESVFSMESMKQHNFFLTAIILFFNFLLSLLESFLRYGIKLPLPKSRMSLLGFGILLASTIGLSNFSLRYLSYTAQVMFKCCKPIPVMLGGWVVQKKSFSTKKIVSCVLITVGIVLFSVADAKTSPSFQPVGIVVICIALTIDAVSPNVQEWIIRRYECSILDTLLYSFGIGSLLLLLLECAVFDIYLALYHLFEAPFTIIFKCFVNSLFNYLGVYYVVAITKHFGALESSLVTNLRKMVTIAISYICFKKPFTMQFLYSGGLVFVGIMMEATTLQRLCQLKGYTAAIFQTLCPRHNLAPQLSRKWFQASV